MELKRWNMSLGKKQKSGVLDIGEPNDAKEPGKYILVFRGKMGKEDDAVAGYVIQPPIEITPPDEYVYAVTDGGKSPQQFPQVKAKLRNTRADAPIGEGTLWAVARYRKVLNYTEDLSAYLPGNLVQVDPEYLYSVSSPISISSLSATEPVEFAFDFESEPIPVGIADLALQVAFKGTIGQEQATAVATGIKDLLEPTHHVFWNLRDMLSLNYHLYTSEQAKTLPDLQWFRNKVDLDHNGVFNEIEKGEPYIDPQKTEYEIQYADSDSPEISAPVATVMLLPGRYIRLIVLVDRQTDNYVRITSIDEFEGKPFFGDLKFQGAINQVDSDGVLEISPGVDSFRSIRQHFHFGIINCDPWSMDAEGNTWCVYPESEAIIPPDLSPYPVNIIFQ